MNRCAEGKYGLIILHRHPTEKVELSGDDRQSATQLAHYFRSVVPERFHGSVVLGDHDAAAMFWHPESAAPIEDVEVRFLGSSIRSFPRPDGSAFDLQEFAQIPLLFGRVARSLMRGTVVAVIGLSGGGSQVVTQLAAMGFGGIVAVDSQRFDAENRLSTDAPRFFDLALRIPKVTVARRQVFAINPRCSFRGVRADIPSAIAVAALRDADIVVGCVNNLAARADILEIAGRYGIPYVDVGFTVRVNEDVAEDSQIAALSGNVFTIVPGGPCMWCSGFLTADKLTREAGGPNRSYLKRNRRTESKAEQPMVLPFNGTLASIGALEVLQLVLGFRPAQPVKFTIGD
jgi:molybdopterin/thiamine biosynthesis adenylyltransferase